jgi:hypothetical protein
LVRQREKRVREVKAAVSLGADVGGKYAHSATAEVCMAIRQALAKRCRGPYGASFAEFALVVRIDGCVQSWGKRGVDNVRLQRKAKYATADIFVPREVWEEGRETFGPFLATNVEAAIRAIVDRVEKAGYSIEADMLVRDVARVTLDFARSS